MNETEFLEKIAFLPFTRPLSEGHLNKENMETIKNAPYHKLAILENLHIVRFEFACDGSVVNALNCSPTKRAKQLFDWRIEYLGKGKIYGIEGEKISDIGMEFTFFNRRTPGNNNLLDRPHVLPRGNWAVGYGYNNAATSTSEWRVYNEEVVTPIPDSYRGQVPFSQTVMTANDGDMIEVNLNVPEFEMFDDDDS